MNNAKTPSSIPRVAWVGLGIVVVLMVASGILVGRVIFGQDDNSRLWLPVMTTVTMIVVAAPTGWCIGSALQQRESEDK